MNISALIVTLNEEHNIYECIKSVQNICDEVVVVDSNSNDKTVEIAKALGAKVITQEYLGGGPQRNLGALHTANDWILNIDADERLDVDMIEEIKTFDLSVSKYDAFAFNRKSFIGDRFQKIWYPDYVARLYDKNKTKFTNDLGHAKLESNNIKKLESNILHYSYRDLSHIVKKLDFFTRIGSRMMYEKRKNISVATPFFRAFYAFFRTYILKRGILCGLDGLTISIYTAFTTYMKYAILYEMYQKDKTNK